MGASLTNGLIRSIVGGRRTVRTPSLLLKMQNAEEARQKQTLGTSVESCLAGSSSPRLYGTQGSCRFRWHFCPGTQGHMISKAISVNVLKAGSLAAAPCSVI
ncbi:unnamed protein product, partial [Phaeothamnion confervicola]